VLSRPALQRVEHRVACRVLRQDERGEIDRALRRLDHLEGARERGLAIGKQLAVVRVAGWWSSGGGQDTLDGGRLAALAAHPVELVLFRCAPPQLPAAECEKKRYADPWNHQHGEQPGPRAGNRPPVDTDARNEDDGESESDDRTRVRKNQVKPRIEAGSHVASYAAHRELHLLGP
jgi:hypothetical protein